MSKSITFFAKRQQSTGQTHEFRVDDGSRTCRFFVYSRAALAKQAVEPRKQPGGSINPDVDKIKTALRTQGQGGVIALTSEESNKNRLILVVPVGAEPAEAFGMILPGHPSVSLEAMTEPRWVPFPAGSHALVPVDKDAETFLRSFQDHLQYLPADLETLVLHAIRDPSLDVRVGLLEAIVRKDTVEPSAKKSWVLRVFPFLAKVPGFENWFGKPVPLWPLATTLLGLLLVVNSALLYMQFLNAPIAIPGVWNLGGGNGDENGPVETPSQKIFRLIDMVRKSPNASLQTLAKNHFAKVQKEEGLASVLAPGDDGKLLVRGLAKLEAFRLNKAEGEKLFGESLNWTAVNNFYQARSLDERSRDLLAALACKGFGSPGLEATKTAPAVSFAETGKDCKSYELEKASPGLDDLLTLVQETK